MYRPVLLKGDYVSSAPHGHERQARARQENCILVVDFHFNAFSNASAKGGEVHYKTDSDESEQLARLMWDAFAHIGLPPHGQPVHGPNERSEFINFYAMPTVLIEPLFITNLDQANLLHDANHFDSLAKAVVRAIRAYVAAGTIGLSPGHAFKTAPDPGSPCIRGDNEVDHVRELVDRVMGLLTP